MSNATNITATTPTTTTTTTTTTIMMSPNNTVYVVNQTNLFGANASGFFTDPDIEETKLSDKERVLLVCITLMIPMVCAVAIAFAIRKIIKNRETNEGYLDLNFSICKKKRMDTSKSNHALQPEEVKTSDTQFSEIPSVEELDDVVTYSGGGRGSSALSATNSHHSGDHTSKSTATANGSIITMTMKNNHLIVETEEPETSLTGIDAPSILYGNSGNEMLVVELLSVDDQRAIVHQDPDSSSTDLINLLQMQQHQPQSINQQQNQSLQRSSTNTGMSQSDLSSSSAGSTCHPYDYGNQSEYIYEGGSNIMRHNFTRSDSTTCPLMQQSSQEDLPHDDDQNGNDNYNHENNDNENNIDDEENHLRLQKQLGNSSNQQTISESQSVRKNSNDQIQQQSQPAPPKQQDPILLKTSTLPTTAMIQYRYIRPTNQDQYSSNIVS